MSLVRVVQDVRRDAARRAASMLPGLPAMQQDDHAVQIAVQAVHRAFNLVAIPPTGTVFKRPVKGGHGPCCIHDGVLRITPFMTRAQAAIHTGGKYTGWQHIQYRCGMWIRSGLAPCMAAGVQGAAQAGAGASMMEVDGEDEDDEDEGLGSCDVWNAPPKLPGWSLADLTCKRGKMPEKLNEEKGMQPIVMKLLKVVAEAVGCDGYLLDTHRKPHLHHPTAKPDCTLLAHETAVPAWPQVVSTFEFKLGTLLTEQYEATGQLVQRSAAALEAQPTRPHILGVSISMNTIEVRLVGTCLHKSGYTRVAAMK